ncbi:thioredoxin family protein [Hansschlegelia beijingensis]|uniref:Thiol-disulfide isomerase/thioredoxin n=1 Tax=Hansschlegelia beijingensis TaxID=1133344 RepID=A0A7W6CX23_9HYPH|nr:thioredoxin family protein [Hansschlegelia beijingensis]MBB3972715.1 thiol-disulfide isomerase/thioredoxin [Hansschlegelia beijingensis]
MLTRRVTLLGGLCAALWSGAAHAAPIAPFSAEAFDAALKQGGPVLVHIHAAWCPICRAQKPILASLLAEPRFAAMKGFEIDFDGDQPSVRKVEARAQSTLIVFKEGREVARSVGERQPEWIEDLLAKAL